MRELASAVLAVPVLVFCYLTTVARRIGLPRLSLAAVVVVVTGVVVLTAGRPESITARPASEAADPPAAAFRTIAVQAAVDAPIAVEFSQPMDAASVEAALSIRPAIDVRTAWDAERTRLTVRPATNWAADTFYALTIGVAAHDATGAALASPVRSSFLTRSGAGAAIAAERMVGDRVALDSAFILTFDRPVDPASVAAAFTIDPPVAGAFDESPPRVGVTRMVFRPAEPLDADTSYQLALDGPATDVEGATTTAGASLLARTAAIPEVVRFRPVDGTKAVEREVDVSVRFTQPMDHLSTRRAFSVTVDGKAVEGTSTWAEGDTVLVIHPAEPLPYGATVALAVGPGALSAAGAPIAAEAKATFTVKAAPPPPPKATPRPTTRPSTGSGSSPIAKPPAGSWAAAERYVITLMNCTRGGGWVEVDGSCSSPGGGSAGPLAYDAGISDKVARPYAKKLATAGVCSHFYGGGPDDRLRAAGYTSYRWGENLGCRYYTDLTRMAINLVRFFQSEKSYNGGHWRNMMDPRFDRAGVGLWISGGNLRIVIDYYHP